MIDRYEIDRFVSNLAAAFGRRMSREQAEIYADKLSKRVHKLNLGLMEFTSILSRIVADEESFPSIAIVYRYLSRTNRGDDPTPVWRTWRDSEGRSWAQKTGSYAPSKVTDAVFAQWQIEKASQAEAREAFAKGFLETGGDPAKLRAYQAAVIPEDELPF